MLAGVDDDAGVRIVAHLRWPAGGLERQLHWEALCRRQSYPGALAAVVVEIAHDGLLQLIDALGDAAADALSGDLGKEPLDHVKPRARSRREVQMKARMQREPGLYRGSLVGCVIVGMICRSRSGGVRWSMFLSKRRTRDGGNGACIRR
jgi:hypothetical protein